MGPRSPKVTSGEAGLEPRTLRCPEWGSHLQAELLGAGFPRGPRREKIRGSGRGVLSGRLCSGSRGTGTDGTLSGGRGLWFISVSTPVPTTVSGSKHLNE